MSWLKYLTGRRDRRVYLDYAATTPLDERVQREMNNVSRRYFANPGSLHTDSVLAREKIEDYRTRMRDMIHAYNHKIIFTRGGTEACNTAVIHGLRCFRESNPNVVMPHVLISPLEHAALHELCLFLQNQNQIELEFLPIDECGVVRVQKLPEMMRPETALVIVQLVNSETGIIQPIKKISHKVRQYKSEQSMQFPLVICDAIQGGDNQDIHVQSLGVDYLALSSSKFYGPKSGGVLCVPARSGVHTGVLVGGSQEYAIRPGTPDIALVAGTVVAYELSCRRRQVETVRQRVLQNYLYHQIQARFSKCVIAVPPELCAPHILHIGIPDFDSEYVVLFFDASGIDVASQSACSAHDGGVSRVVEYLWNNREDREDPSQYAHIRFSFGRYTTQSDIEKILVVLAKLLQQIYVRA